MNPDYINAIFMFTGAFFTWKNTSILYRDKEIKGIYLPTTVFFSMWGLWNLIYFPILHQWFSFIGGIFLVSGNITWIILALKYQKKKNGYENE